MSSVERFSRNRRRKKHGSSWLARSKRLCDSDPSQAAVGDEPDRFVSTNAHIQHSNSDLQPDSVPFQEALDVQTAAPPSTHHTRSSDKYSSNLKEVTRASAMMTKPTILAILTLYGACGFTSRQYEFLLLLLAIVNSEFRLPCVSTVRRRKWPFFTNHLFPKLSVVTLPRKYRFVLPADTNFEGAYINADSHVYQEQDPAEKEHVQSRGTTPRTFNLEDGSQEQMETGSSATTSPVNNAPRRAPPPADTSSSTETATAVIVPISSWAKFDVSNVVIRDELVHGQQLSVRTTQTVERTIEHSRLCTECDRMTVEQNSTTVRTEDGRSQMAMRNDRLKIECMPLDSSTIEDCPQLFQPVANSATEISLSGTVSFTFCPGVFLGQCYSLCGFLSPLPSWYRRTPAFDEHKYI